MADNLSTEEATEVTQANSAKSTGGPKGKGTKKPYKRKLTEKRRLQNRAAQRTYRTKRKERIEFLEQAVAAVHGEDGQESPEPPESRNVHVEDADQGEGSSNSVDPEGGRSFFRNEDYLHARLFMNSGTLPQSPVISRILDDINVLDNAVPRSSAQSTRESLIVQGSNTLGLQQALDIRDEQDVNDLLEFATEKQLSLKEVFLAGLRSLKSKDNVLHCDALIRTCRDQPFPRSNTAHQTLPIPSHIRPENMVPLLPDPLMSRVFLRHQTLYEVFFQNSAKIGLSLEQITRPGTPSPFSNMLGPCIPAVPISGIPPDLHPTPSQLRLPHHPFFDLIPLPWFRDRAIALSYRNPPAFDRFDLKRDILSGGLVCWKSRARDSGQPWDRRSWEAEPWFLEKWGWLCEEQGKVEQQSRWWRGLREE
ncbi:hypothetical protein EJ04DRAFT_549050 [Polyplosphaeria fusca]|uniref:BZIP domain-containing protein n=1 Tax=Polyplosphaeria fusca TaxID=682080 RepID=A0A9P4RAB8_9PLEO|nr:hypothetical protein EJ04DRAFT_549050 [Polyplosphaeria fusca]